MNKDQKLKNNEISENLKQLVVARIEAKMSSNLKLSIGSDGSLDKSEMIKHVEMGDDIGRKIIDVHLNFMKAQSSGQLTTALNTV